MWNKIAEKIIERGSDVGRLSESIQLAENYLALFDKVFAEKGEPLPDTIEAHKYHINLLAEQIESDRVEISKLSQTVNQLKQSKAGKKIEELEAENERLRDLLSRLNLAAMPLRDYWESPLRETVDKALQTSDKEG